MHGHGVYVWKDGRRYEGEYLDDRKHGYGVYVWTDGRRYEGNWAAGKQHGQGKYILPDGTSKTGIWENGKRIRWLDGEEDARVDGRHYEHDLDNLKGNTYGQQSNGQIINYGQH